VSLQRVEAKVLYVEHEHRKNQILLKQKRLHLNQSKAPDDLLNTKLLWHGTGHTHPSTVVKHQQGLDPRFSRGECGLENFNFKLKYTTAYTTNHSCVVLLLLNPHNKVDSMEGGFILLKIHATVMEMGPVLTLSVMQMGNSAFSCLKQL
jgi:hypothetical protein